MLTPLPTVRPKLIAVLNGPNMNMLGLRQPAIYGSETLDDVESLCAETAEALDLAIDFRQSNIEGELISWIQEARTRAAGIVINPAGYTTTSIALMDALLASELPVIEVHITNIHRREEFRQHSYVSKVAVGVICGLGVARLCAGADRDGRIAAGQGPPMTRIPFDTAEIRALAQILADTGLTEIEIAEGDSRIRVARAPAPVTAYAPGVAPALAAPAPRPRRRSRTTPPIQVRSPVRWSAWSICRPSPASRRS